MQVKGRAMTERTKETRKTDFLGETFGMWVVTARGEGGGDRKRRWVVRNTESGVEMTVLQTDLKDLALAKTLADKNAEVPGQMQIPGDRPEPPLSLEEAEAALLRRLDAQIGAATTEYDRVAAATNHLSALERINLAREARASTALDGQTYVIENCVDYQMLAEQEIAAGETFGISATTLAILAEANRCESDLVPGLNGTQSGRCVNCENGDHPDLPLQTATAGALIELTETFKVQLHRAAKMIAEARAKMDAAEYVIADVLEGMLP